MKFRQLLPLAALVIAAASLRAQVPQILNYQGRIISGTTNFTGTGQFRFSLVNSNASATFWSNDGATPPATSVSLPVSNGLYAVLLGDTTIANMTAVIPPTVFTNSDVRLRVWFNDGVSGLQLLSPDQRIASVGYAMMAANIPDGSITSNKLANGAVTGVKIADGSITTAKLASNSVTSLQLSNNIAIGTSNTVNGLLNVYRTSVGTPAITLDGANSQISTFGSDGLEQIRLWGAGYGEIFLNNSRVENGRAVLLSANGGNGGFLGLYNTNNSTRVSLSGANSGGSLMLYQADGNTGARILGDSSGSGRFDLYNTNGSTRVTLFGQSSTTNSGGEISVLSSNGTETVEILGQGDAYTGGKLTLKQRSGTVGAALVAEFGSGEGAAFDLFNSSGDLGLRLEGDYNDGGRATFYSSAGLMTVDIQGDSGDAGYLRLFNTNASTRVYLDGLGSSGGGQATLYANDGSSTINLYGESPDGDGGEISVGNYVSTEVAQLVGNTYGGTLTLKDDAGANTVIVTASSGGGGFATFYQADGQSGVFIDGDSSGAGYIAVYGTNGVANIILDGYSSGDGRISCDVLQINGGSDLSEQFDINAAADQLKPGMIVCIDPKNPGELVLSSQAYDRTVAGVVSGAGGVKPGMLMGQVGTKADGKHPVALTGRVYCYVDADAGGAVQPGDLITTATTPGHGMKVTDHVRSQGAIIGKAMSSLPSGKGLVLVLVSLQ